MKKKTIVTLIILVFCTFSVFSQIKIYSGVPEGSYNRLASDLMKISKQEVEVVETEGSAENFQKLISEKGANIALMQYDVLVSKRLEDSTLTKDIKVLFPLDYEEIHLIAYKDANIKKLSDLAGKHVAIGSSNQGTNITAKLIKRQTNIQWIDVEIGFNDAFVGLLVGTVDAFFFVGGVPVKKLKDLSPDFANMIEIVPIEARSLDRIYTKTKIKAYTYKWSKKHINTYAVKSVVTVNTAKTNKKSLKKIDNLLKDVNTNIEKLRKEGHPKWRRAEFNFENIEWTIYENSKDIFK